MLRRAMGSADTAPAGARVRPPPERPFWHSIFVFRQYIRRVEAESTMTTTEKDDRCDEHSEEQLAKSRAEHYAHDKGCTDERRAAADPGDLMAGFDEFEMESREQREIDCKRPKLVLEDPDFTDLGDFDDGPAVVLRNPDCVDHGNEPTSPPDNLDTTQFSFEDVNIQFTFDETPGAAAGGPAAPPQAAPAAAPAKKGRAPVPSGIRRPGKPKQNPSTGEISEEDKLKIEEFIKWCNGNLHLIEHEAMEKKGKPGHKFTFMERQTVVHLMRSASEGTLERELTWKRAVLCSSRKRGILYCSCSHRLQSMGGGQLHLRHRAEYCSPKDNTPTEP